MIACQKAALITFQVHGNVDASKNSNFFFEESVFTGVFKIQSNNDDGAFSVNSLGLLNWNLPKADIL